MAIQDELAPQFTEPTIIQDIFTTGAAHVSAAGDGSLRLTFYVDIDINLGGAEVEHRIMDRVIVPLAAIPALLVMLSDAMALHPDGVALMGHRRVASH